MFEPKAKSAIFILTQGGLSQMDSFDYKPALEKYDGRKMTPEILPGVGEVKTFFGGDHQPLMKSSFRFKKAGQCGKRVSALFPCFSECVDDVAFIHSLKSDNNNHAPAMFQINTGTIQQGYPSIGAWVTYALGSANPDLPGYIVMSEHNSLPLGGPANWGSGFLPAAYQGTLLRSGPTPILDLAPPPELTGALERRSLELLSELNETHLRARSGDSELEARIASYALAFRMQARTPEVVDLSRETKETRDLYGADQKETEDLGRKLLLARRLIERGVRFVQIYSGNYQDGGEAWDAHGNLPANHRKHALALDRPLAGLLKDLKRTGLLEETLVVSASEFGRMPISQGQEGRDHNPGVQTAWLAGAGVRPGISVGSSDELGYQAAEEPHPLRDLHATILSLLGLDDMRLTYYFNGRNQRLTENGGQVIRRALA
jgi:hypothetical protein